MEELFLILDNSHYEHGHPINMDKIRHYFDCDFYKECNPCWDFEIKVQSDHVYIYAHSAVDCGETEPTRWFNWEKLSDGSFYYVIARRFEMPQVSSLKGKPVQIIVSPEQQDWLKKKGNITDTILNAIASQYADFPRNKTPNGGKRYERVKVGDTVIVKSTAIGCEADQEQDVHFLRGQKAIVIKVLKGNEIVVQSQAGITVNLKHNEVENV